MGPLAMAIATLQGWLAVIGGAIAAAAFVAGRLDLSRSQASAVYALVVSYRYGSSAPPDDPPHHTTVELRNDSDLPVLDVGLSAWQWGSRRWSWRVRPHNDWMTGQRITGRVYPTLTPRTTVTDDSLPPVAGLDPAGSESLRPPVLLTFRDGSGRRWVRWPDGKLSRRWPSR